MSQIEQVDWGMTRDSDYPASGASWVYEDKFDDCWDRFPAKGSAHPDLGSEYKLKTVNVSRQAAGKVLVTCRYEVDQGGGSSSGEWGSEDEYQFDASCSMEPLLSHKKFKNLSDEEKDALNAVMAGTRPNEKMKIGDEEKTPNEIITSVPGRKALQLIREGMESYYMPSVTYSVTSDVSGSVDLSKLGKIDTPDGSPPTIESGKDWLLDGVSGRKSASEKWRLTKVWKLSGSKGWTEYIYKD